MENSLVGMELSDVETLLGPQEPKFRARQIYDALYRERIIPETGRAKGPADAPGL